MPENAERWLRAITRKEPVGYLKRCLLLGEVLLQGDTEGADTIRMANRVDALMHWPRLLQEVTLFREGWIAGRWDCATPIFRITLSLVMAGLRCPSVAVWEPTLGRANWEKRVGVEEEGAKYIFHAGLGATASQHEADREDGINVKKISWTPTRARKPVTRHKGFIRRMMPSRPNNTQTRVPSILVPGITHTTPSPDRSAWDLEDWYASFVLKMVGVLEDDYQLRRQPQQILETILWLRAMSAGDQIWVLYHLLLWEHLAEKHELWLRHRASRWTAAKLVTAIPDYSKYYYEKVWNGGF